MAEMEKAEGDALAAEAVASFAGVYETLQQFGPHYTTKQKNDLKALLEPRHAATTKTGTSRPPKFQIPDGTTWAGTGRQPSAFLAWAETAEGKAWKRNTRTKNGRRIRSRPDRIFSVADKAPVFRGFCGR